ncbi:MAG TPA: hypothetical protein VMW49_02815 [Candidatus Dormibacteraeota bacterium]|nr:hypothetical protein [Candidatus Dormibacteraeota bacterium]
MSKRRGSQRYGSGVRGGRPGGGPRPEAGGRAQPGARPGRRPATPPRWRPSGTVLSVVGLVVVVLAVILYLDYGIPGPPPSPYLTHVVGRPTGQPVSGIQCDNPPKLVYHHHAHLAIFAAGKPVVVPAGIGIPGPLGITAGNSPSISVPGGRCLYWLHTHTADGLIHIETPVNRTFTLGQFFAIWHEPLSRHQVAAASGTVTVYLNGRPYAGNPSAIPLLEHTEIQIDEGRPAVPFRAYTFPAGT